MGDYMVHPRFCVFRSVGFGVDNSGKESEAVFTLPVFFFRCILLRKHAGMDGNSILCFCRANTRRVWIFEFGIELRRLDPGHRDSLRTPTARNSDLPRPPILAYAVDAMGVTPW